MTTYKDITFRVHVTGALDDQKVQAASDFVEQAVLDMIDVDEDGSLQSVSVQVQDGTPFGEGR